MSERLSRDMLEKEIFPRLALMWVEKQPPRTDAPEELSRMFFSAYDRIVSDYEKRNKS